MRIFMALVILSLIGLTIQDCCGSDDRRTRSGCCGNGPCNMFCCNCDNSCDWKCTNWMNCWTSGEYGEDKCTYSGEYGKDMKRSIREAARDSKRRFNSVDANGDGVITKDEGRDYLLNGTSSARMKRDIENGGWFDKIDRNGDGIIEPKEFDNTLA